MLLLGIYYISFMFPSFGKLKKQKLKWFDQIHLLGSKEKKEKKTLEMKYT